MPYELDAVGNFMVCTVTLKFGQKLGPEDLGRGDLSVSVHVQSLSV